MNFAIVETNFKRGLYIPTVLLDELGVSDATYVTTAHMALCKHVLTIHIYEAGDDAVMDNMPINSEMLIITDTDISHDISQQMVRVKMQELCNTMSADRRSPHVDLTGYGAPVCGEYTLGITNRLTRHITTPIGAYIDLFSLMVMTTFDASRFYLSEPQYVGLHKVVVATFTNSGYLGRLAVDSRVCVDFVKDS